MERVTTRRTVLRNGFAFVIGLLALSIGLAYFIQESYLARAVEIHREYVFEQESLTSLARNQMMANIALRDYFLSDVPDKEESYRAQVTSLQSESEALLSQLRKLSLDQVTIDELDKRFRELWATLLLPSESSERRPFEFLQQEVKPRREAAARVLQDLVRSNRSSLETSEKRFHSTRAAATRSLLAILGTCLLTGIAVAVSSLRYSNELEHQADEQFREVSEANVQLEQLSARLMEIQEEERTKLARELHDEVVQNLAVLKMEMNRALLATPGTMPELRRNLGEARALAESTMRSVRDISMLLRPSLLDDLGLGPALQAQAEDFMRRTGTACEIDDSGATDDLSPAVKTCAYRVVQEALRNCEKHARATRVRVRVARVDTDLIVEVSDNGVGFDMDARKSPFQLGVLGMKERASALGGRLTLESRHSKGTQIRLEIPLHANEATLVPQEIKV